MEDFGLDCNQRKDLNLININELGAERVSEMKLEQAQPNARLRVFINGGGCQGFQYGLTLDEEQNDDDDIFESNGVEIVIDRTSQLYLFGSTINFVEEFGGYSFSIDNPNANSSCSCGSSFSCG